ncbi:interleukin-21 receptor [Aplochiton taeniatus]
MEKKMSAYEFMADTEYTARVRSSPNQGHYKGEWSEWSSAVHWKTDGVIQDTPFMDWRLITPLCVLIPLLICLVCFPIKLRKHIFIPTPEPYFQSLYSDYHGDFKSWVVTSTQGKDLLRIEETMQIDTLTETMPDRDQDSSQLHHMAMDEGPKSR